MKQLLWILCILPLLAASCRDDGPEVAPIDQLPPATQSGKYIFGCLVNGGAFVPENTRDITAIYQQGILVLGADTDIRDSTLGMGLNLKNQNVRTQTYKLDSSWERGVEFISATCRYEYENLVEGTLTITHFDDEEYIISGTFEFVTATEGCDTIRVTDGRFDIPYIP